MGAKLGPRIISDNLVLALDCADAKSYAGEPTTNLVTSSAVDFSVMSGYTGNTFSQVVDSESPSGYACEMSYTGTVNSASRSKFGDATNIPTSGTGFVSIWAKKSAGLSTTMRPKVYTGYDWYDLEPLDGGSIYFTDEYRPFGAAVTFGTNSGGPNPGFSMTHGGNSTENDKTRWIKPQVTTSSYNVPFANLSRSTTNGWVDLSGNSNDGTLVNGVVTGASHYRSGDVILPNSARYLDFDGSDDYVDCGSSPITSNSIFSWEAWIYPSTTGTPFFLGTNSTSQAMVSYWDSANNKVRVGMWGSDKLTSSTAISGGWGHTCWTWDGTTLRAYTNGVADGTATGFSFNIASNYMMVGSAPAAQRFGGKIGAVKLYNKVLTAAEVLDNYNSTKSRFS